MFSLRRIAFGVLLLNSIILPCYAEQPLQMEDTPNIHMVYFLFLLGVLILLLMIEGPELLNAVPGHIADRQRANMQYNHPFLSAFLNR